jgi:uncharacterized protein YecE (DUF72 family)
MFYETSELKILNLVKSHIMKLLIGCSGYNYKAWKHIFYPDKLAVKKWLEYYATHFNTVEINNTFYGFPKEETLKRWADQTPEDFIFTIKANRFFTHSKKLNVDEKFKESLEDFQRLLKVLKGKLGCVLWQLPANLHQNIVKIRSLASILDFGAEQVIEFRHESWFTDETYQEMRNHHLGYCILSAPGKIPEDTVTTTQTAYIRFHGKSKWYDYLYSDDELQQWKNRIEELKGIDRLFVYFNNDTHGHAVKNALKLKELLGD